MKIKKVITKNHIKDLSVFHSCTASVCLFLSTLSCSEQGTEVTLFVSVDQPAGLRLVSSDGDERRDCVGNAHCVCYTRFYTEVGFIQILPSIVGVLHW